MLLTHGIPKISMLLENPSDFSDPIGLGGTFSLILAIMGEVIAPVFILIGLKTKIAAIPVIITMGVATFIIHAEDSFATKEKALLYMFGFITIALAGAGRYSVDGRK